MLETLVHLEIDASNVPTDFVLLEVEFPRESAVEILAESALLSDWRDNEEHSREIGDDWLISGQSALLRVPSALVPKSFNYLFNPRHEAARSAAIVAAYQHPYDQRLFRGG